MPASRIPTTAAERASDTLALLFVLGYPQPTPDVAAALPTLGIDGAESLSLLTVDGDVDNQDYNPFHNAFGSNYLLAADGNRNNLVDAADYVLWRKMAGPAASPQPSPAIPFALNDESFQLSLAFLLS